MVQPHLSSAKRSRQPVDDDAELSANQLSVLAGIEPKINMKYVDAMSIEHASEDSDKELESWTYKDDEEAKLTLHRIIGTYWRIGGYGGRPLWAREMQATVLPHL